MLRYIEKANSAIKSKHMQMFDWCMSLIFVGVGISMIYKSGLNLSSGLTLGCGILGLVLAYIRPAVRLQEYFEKRLIRNIKKNV